MSSAFDRLRRVAAVFAVTGLLGLAAACGTTADAPTSAAGPTTAAAKAKTAQKGGGKTVDAGMQASCDAVHQLFAALDSGDKGKAEKLRSTSHDMFQAIHEYTAGPDKQLASNAEAMEDLLGKLPEAPIGQSGLAKTYAVDCVRQYGTAPLKG